MFTLQRVLIIEFKVDHIFLYYYLDLLTDFCGN